MLAHLRPIAVAACDNSFAWACGPLQDQAGVRLVLRQRDRLVEQRLVMHDAAGLDAAACG